MEDHSKYYEASKTQRPLEPINFSGNQSRKVNSKAGEEKYSASQNSGLPSLGWKTENT